MLRLSYAQNKPASIEELAAVPNVTATRLKTSRRVLGLKSKHPKGGMSFTAKEALAAFTVIEEKFFESITLETPHVALLRERMLKD